MEASVATGGLVPSSKPERGRPARGHRRQSAMPPAANFTRSPPGS